MDHTFLPYIHYTQVTSVQTISTNMTHRNIKVISFSFFSHTFLWCFFFCIPPNSHPQDSSTGMVSFSSIHIASGHGIHVLSYKIMHMVPRSVVNELSSHQCRSGSIQGVATLDILWSQLGQVAFSTVPRFLFYRKTTETPPSLLMTQIFDKL